MLIIVITYFQETLVSSKMENHQSLMTIATKIILWLEEDKCLFTIEFTDFI